MLIFDPWYWIIVGPTLALAAWAAWRVKSTFHRYADRGVLSGMTGAQAAALVAGRGGADVKIERVAGFLSDHYDPRTKTLRLSPDVYDGRSIAAVAVGAHEAGHAIQDVRQYAPLKLRSQLVPVANLGSNLWVYMAMFGLIMNFQPLLLAAIVLLGGTVLFQLVTLPVEFDASRRAKLVLAEAGVLRSEEEREGVSKVLSAAAMTYVAGALTAVATLFFLIMRARD
jgi:hypothetical protein